MGIKLQYKISLISNTFIALGFIGLMLFAFTNLGAPDSMTAVIAVSIIFSYAVCLLFNLLCFKLAKTNNENQASSGWTIKYSSVILVCTIIVLVIIAFIFIAAAVSLVNNSEQYKSKQFKPYIIFLSAIFISLATGIINIIFYYKTKKANKLIANNVIESIGQNH